MGGKTAPQALEEVRLGLRASIGLVPQTRDDVDPDHSRNTGDAPERTNVRTIHSFILSENKSVNLRNATKE